jgi:lipid-A-disaccharide synthase
MKKKIFIVAGEASGDYLGAKLIEALDLSSFEIQAIGGPLMAKAGAKIVQDYQKIALMGFFEVLIKIIPLLLFLNKVKKIIKKYKPDLIITIDSPSFNFRLIKSLKGLAPAIHYVAPSVWAYSPERVKIVKELYQGILLLFPFEVPYFNSMPHYLVGHPLLEVELILNSITLEERLKKDQNPKNIKITLLPGSRLMEIKNHLPILLEAAAKLLNQYKALDFYLITLPELEETLNNYLNTSPIKNKIHLISDSHEKKKILEKSSLGWVKSGTVTLDFLGSTVPAITFYKVSAITLFFLKKKLKISHFNLVNIINNDDILPELLQDNFTSDNLYKKTIELLENNNEREKIIRAYYRAYDKIYQEEKPSQKAAKIIESYVNKKF